MNQINFCCAKSHKMCPIVMCICCISAVAMQVGGVLITDSAIFAAFEFLFGPVKRIFEIPRDFDFSSKLIMFLLSPLVDIAIKKSLSLPIASSSLEKIYSNP